MKGINAWAKELKHNEKFAKKFEGVQTVQDILSLAKKNGYYFTAEELKNYDLDSISGGASPLGGIMGSASIPSAGNITVNPNINPNISTDVTVNKVSNAATATAEHATAQSNPNINISNK